MEIKRYILGAIFSHCFLFVQCDTVETNADAFKSIKNMVTTYPELVYQSMNDYKIQLVDLVKSRIVRISGERSENIPIVDKEKQSNASKSSRTNKKFGSIDKLKKNNGRKKDNSNDDVKSIIQRDNCEFSGFLIDGGYILTNYSLLRNYNKFSTIVDTLEKKKNVTKKVSLDLVGYDEYLDVAVLKGDFKSLNTLSFGDYGQSKVHRYVYPICGDDYKVSGCTEVEFKTLGAKKKFNKNSTSDNTVEKMNCYSTSYSHLRTCVLVDISGVLVGLKVYGGKFYNNKMCDYDSILPYNELKKAVNNIISKRYNSYNYGYFDLVSVNDIVKSLNRLSVDKGCYIEKVNDDLSRCGLMAGDVITSVNDIKVNGIDEFDYLYNSVRNNDVDFVITRKNNNATVNVKVPSGILSSVKYELKDGVLSVGGAKLVDLTDAQLKMLKDRSASNLKGVLVSSCGSEWECGKDFVITAVYGKYKIECVNDLVNVFKNIKSCYSTFKDGEKVPFYFSGFKMSDPSSEHENPFSVRGGI